MSERARFSKARMLTEAAIMVAIGTVLYLLKLMNLPYGGAVTIASTLPIVIISYRHGIRFGLLTGFVYGLLMQLLQFNTLSYVTTWQSVLAVIMLDFIVAFMVMGLGGMFRNRMSQPMALMYGSLVACILRYICHVISGATVWAGLSIPTNAALLYSLGYNATYMVPETIVTVLLAFEIGNLIDFSSDRIRQFSGKGEKAKNAFSVLKLAGAVVFAAALIYDVRSVFIRLQNAETGDFDITGLSDVNWFAIVIVSLIGVVVSVILFMIDGNREQPDSERDSA